MGGVLGSDGVVLGALGTRMYMLQHSQMGVNSVTCTCMPATLSTNR